MAGNGRGGTREVRRQGRWGQRTVRPRDGGLCSTKHREEVKEELGEGARVGDIAKRLGEKWKELTDEDKQEYTAEAKTQKEAYDIAMEYTAEAKTQKEAY